MANKYQFSLLNQDLQEWNQWRKVNADEKINIRGADLSGADLKGADLWITDFSGANLRGINLRRANLRGAVLSGADLRGANLQEADLQEADLRGAVLSGADLEGADLWITDFSGANLSGTNLRRANLRGAVLSGVVLSGADLSFANLRGADLSFANLRGVDLSFANLRRANFQGADLRNANLRKADLGRGNLWAMILKVGQTLRSIDVSEILPAPRPRKPSSRETFIQSGPILFDTPEQMQVGIPKLISIRIARQETEELFKDLRHIKVNENIQKVRVSRVMAAELKGEKFKIEALSSEEQIVEDDGFTLWEWHVFPLKKGRQQLIAIVTIILQVEGERGVKTLPVLVKEINIRINRFYSAKVFISQHWQWLIASAALPVAALIVTVLTT